MILWPNRECNQGIWCISRGHKSSKTNKADHPNSNDSMGAQQTRPIQDQEGSFDAGLQTRTPNASIAAITAISLEIVHKNPKTLDMDREAEAVVEAEAEAEVEVVDRISGPGPIITKTRGRWEATTCAQNTAMQTAPRTGTGILARGHQKQKFFRGILHPPHITTHRCRVNSIQVDMLGITITGALRSRSTCRAREIPQAISNSKEGHRDRARLTDQTPLL